jgi:hypothetical protein
MGHFQEWLRLVQESVRPQSLPALMVVRVLVEV